MNILFKSIVESCSVPGNEVMLRDLLIKELELYGTIHHSKWTGFYCAHKNNRDDKQKKIVITAHMDSPGFIVKDIETDGTLKVISLGGLSPQLMDIRGVRLLTKEGEYHGALTLNEKKIEDARRVTYKGFFGFSSKENAVEKGVTVGDSICFDTVVQELENDHVMAPHLDNRLGIYLLIDIAKALHEVDLDVNIYFAATSCEEMGGRDARILANMIEPDIAICLDATYEEGSVKMGKGAVMTLADSSVLIPTKLRDAISKIATSSDIPIQYEVFNYAGTDAKDFKDVANGCLTLCFLIATLNNHSPYEICSWRDVEYTTKLVCATIKNHESLVV